MIGARLGHGRWRPYQLLRVLATGARARVFLASDGRDAVAVKVFPQRMRDRAENELRCASRVRHPNVVQVHALDEVDGYPAVVMRYCEGRRLGEWLATEPALGAVVHAFSDVLAALEAVHAAQLVHRDVKPENVIVDAKGVPRLIDFDLAVAEDDEAALRTLAGTVAYLSPEQTRGERATPASDLYAAGVMLYRALTGEVPFSGSVDDVVAAHRRDAAPAPSAFDPRLAPFDPIVGRLLEKRPELRFASAAEARERLTRVAVPH